MHPATKLRPQEQGNVLFLILIAVALFVALSYAITSSTGSGNTSISKEKARAYASQIVQFNTTIRSTVMRLKVGGACTDTTLNFYNLAYKNYGGTALTPKNNKSPATKLCDVFDAIGGGLSPIIPPAGALITDAAVTSGTWMPGHLTFRVGQMRGVGTDDVAGTESANDLVALHYLINRDTCIAINELLGVENPNGEPPVGTPFAVTAYGNGSYVSAGISDNPETNGHEGYCRNTSTAGYQNIFTIIER